MPQEDNFEQDIEWVMEQKREIEKAKTKHANIQGQVDQLKKDLKSKYNCSSVKQAEKRIKELDESNEQLQKDITEKVNELKERLNKEKSTEECRKDIDNLFGPTRKS